MWNLPRVIHVKVPPPKHQKPESTKPLKSKSPDPGTYNPNYGLCSERIKVKKIYPSNSKHKFSFDEQVKQSKMRPPVGTYTVTSDSLKRLSATPLSLRILRHWLLLLKWIGLLFCLDRSLPMGFWCVYSFSLCTRRFENGSGMASFISLMLNFLLSNSSSDEKFISFFVLYEIISLTSGVSTIGTGNWVFLFCARK